MNGMTAVVRRDLLQTRRLQAVRCLLAAGAASWVVLAAGSSHAQDTAQANEAARQASTSQGQAAKDAASEDIVVTGSRIARGGFDAPTPTTVIGQEDLKLGGSANIADILNETPSFKAAVTPTASTTAAGSAGQNILSLRGLGTSRTLVLVDGRRHVPSNSAGTFNLNVIPSGLIERVEVVTGGASAAWGSDAVAGVVNLLLDKDREGLSGEVQYGLTTYGDGQEYRAALTYGTKFADGRGHFVISGEIADNKGIDKQSDRPWGRHGWQVITNPAFAPGNGQFQRLTVRNAHIANATKGGLIVGGPLANIEFGPGGVPEPFVRGANAGSSFMEGGDGTNLGLDVTLQVPVERQTAFARASYEVADNVTAFAEASYGRTFSDFPILPTFDFGTLTIQQDNAFLPDSIRQQMIAANLPTIRVGRLNTDFGYVFSTNENVTKRGVVGFEGTFGDSWKWDAYGQYGKTRINGKLRNSRIQPNYLLALDAVVDPISGNVVCRSRTPGCAPLNIFGEGSPSAAALDYISADQVSLTDITQKVAAINFDGEPFSTWAGPVLVAFGGEYRKEVVDQEVDDLTLQNAFTLGNAVPIDGAISVRELYGEAAVPLLSDLSWAKSLELNLAVRASNYKVHDRNRSFWETTWKAGLTYAPNDSLRLRVTRSRDIRAPNIGELFASNRTIFRTITDPENPGQQFNIRMVLGGNVDLNPERADTFTAGIVYTPGWFPGLRASVDVYDIKIKGAVGSLEAQDIINRCDGGATQLCSLITRDASNIIQQVQATIINLNEVKTRGVDFELAYRSSLANLSADLPGDISLRVLGTYVDKLVTDDGINAVDRAGDVGPFLEGLPHWRWNASATYHNGPTTFQLQGRYVGGGKYDHTFGEFGIDDNDVSSRFYVDASIQHNILDEGDKRAQLFFAVNNLFDVAPPLAPDSVFIPLATNKQIYDVVGRYLTAGLRFNY